MFHRLVPVALAASCLALTACAGPTGTPQFDTANIAADSRFAEYDKVYIADVTYDASIAERETRFGNSSRNDRPVRERDLEAKASDLEKELRQQIGRTKQIVSSPGAGVLTVSARITDLASNQPTMADFDDNPGLSQRSQYVGKSSVSITLNADGQTLATLSETYQGNFADNGVGQPPTWQDADRGFYITANKVARLIG